MYGSQSHAARRLAQMPIPELQAFADGGAVAFGSRGVAGLRDLIPKVQAMGYQQSAPTEPSGAARLRSMIPQMEAMGYKQQPQHLARGGVVRGPGTGTSDSIETEAEPGTFIMPADSTQAIGPGALEKLGTVPVKLSNGEFEFPPEQVMALGAAVLKLLKDTTHTPVNGEDGGQTDAEVGEMPTDRLAELPQFADGGLIGNEVTRVGNSYSGGNVSGGIAVNGQAPGGTVSTSSWTSPAPAPAPAPAPTIVATNTVAPAASPAPAPAAPMGWAERNAQRSNEVTASSILDSPERRAAQAALTPPPAPALTPAPAPQAPGYPPASQRLGTLPGAGYQPRRYADGGMVDLPRRRYVDGGLTGSEDRAVFGFYPQLTDHGKTSRATADKLQQGVQATGPTSFQPTAPAAEPPPAPAATRMNSLTDPRSLAFAGTSEPAAQTPAPQGNGALSRAATMAGPAAQSSPAPVPTGNVTRTGSSYTGPANIAGDVTINGSAPNSGGYVGAPNTEAALGLARRGAADAMALMPNAPAPVQAPTIRNSTNDWAARKNLENLATAASSITNDRRWGGAGEKSQDRMALSQALATDAALQQAQPGMDLAAMRERGDTQRAGLQAAAAGANAAADRMAALDRTLITERGNNTRAGITALAGLEGARLKADASGNKPLNDVQSKALQFGTRMQTAGAALDKLAAQGVNQPGLIKRGADAVGLGAAANWTQSGEQQQVEQGQRDFINAVLRRESGAAIADSEFANARQQYFPQPGDSPEVIAQKRKNREIATAGVLAEVPDSEKRVNQVLTQANANPQAGKPAAGGPVPDDVGALLKKYGG